MRALLFLVVLGFLASVAYSTPVKVSKRYDADAEPYNPDDFKVEGEVDEWDDEEDTLEELEEFEEDLIDEMEEIEDELEQIEEEKEEIIREKARKFMQNEDEEKVLNDLENMAQNRKK
jgi:TPP-dependent pyruvate/acetoin dehydrogenase alpha subunit